MVASQFQYQVKKNRKDAQPKNPVSDFVQKLNVAWKIFFPEQPQVSWRVDVQSCSFYFPSGIFPGVV
jgi:hypothetical protein